MQCKQIVKTGSQCKVHAMHDSEYCYAHNPATRIEHFHSAQKGGSVTPSQTYTMLPAIDLTRPTAALTVLSDVINRVRRINPDGSMDSKVATTVGFLVGKLFEGHKLIALEERIEKLEGMVQEEK